MPALQTGRGQLENVKVLLAAGADANATAVNPDQPGSAPFDAIAVARERNHPEITALLLQAKEAPAKAKR
jgi:hypothetical protein